MKGTNLIRNRLESLNDSLYVRLRTAETELYRILEYSQGGQHLSFTPHGLSHVTAVELNYDWLLSQTDIDSLNASECFCLLVATIAHDVLMIPRRAGDEARARKEHAKKPLSFLQANGDRLHINIHEAQAIADIIRAHGVTDISEINEHTILSHDRVNLQKLGACLSMADLCNADESRAPGIVFNYLTLDEESATHWRRHMQIGGIMRSGTSIEVSATTFTDEGDEAVQEYIETIEEQLSIVSPFFRTELTPILDVKLTKRRLASPMDQELTFRTDPGSILETLTSGVYDRPDVYIRELVQNSLDATYIREAVERRRGAKYEPQIVLTRYRERGVPRAFRIDDNGCGMDFVDIQDVLLTVGSSIARRRSTQDLLLGTTRKNLIATFGIGLLSCLKVADEIQITTSKGREQEGIRITIRGLGGQITSEHVEDDGQGTTVLVLLKEGSPKPYDEDDEDDKAELSDILGESAVAYYCRYITQAALFVADLDWSPEVEQLPRSEHMVIAGSAENRIDPKEPSGHCLTQVFGDNYTAWLWFKILPKEGFLESHEGQAEILNDGIYVTHEGSSAWVSDAFRHCSARINFVAGAVNLSVSRNKVVQDAKHLKVKRELAVKARALARTLSALTADPKHRTAAALALTCIYNDHPEEDDPRLFAEMKAYCVPMVTGEVVTLANVKQAQPPLIYMAYSAGSVVDSLVEFDGKTLYHKEDDIVTLQANVLAGQGETVLMLARSDNKDGPVEAHLINAYFENADIDVTDLTQERPIEGALKSEPLPQALRKRLGNQVKFVRIKQLSKTRAWSVGHETWLNLAHPEVAICYEVLQRSAAQNDAADREIQFLAELFIQLLACKFPEALRGVTFRLAGLQTRSESRSR